MPILSNDQHEKFVREIVKGSAPHAAYKAAGYKAKSVSVASAAASRLLSNVIVKQRLAELQTKAEEKAVINKAWVLRRLVENVDRAMTAEPVRDKEGNPSGTFTYNGSVANRALELLGKEIGMFVDRSEVGKPGDFDHYSDDDLAKFVSEEFKQVQALRGAPAVSKRH
jgi:phage terminase small subunit